MKVLRGKWPLLAALAFLVPLMSSSATTASQSIRYGYSATEYVRHIEALLHFSPGDTRVVPELNGTIQYIGTKALPGEVYAIYIKRLD